ncbi:MAG: hypothetical protein HY719_05235 [Planctomycetes bacterium]|nr:hypothetical protein [Planctomycetota bacterium]
MIFHLFTKPVFRGRRARSTARMLPVLTALAAAAGCREKQAMIPSDKTGADFLSNVSTHWGQTPEAMREAFTVFFVLALGVVAFLLYRQKLAPKIAARRKMEETLASLFDAHGLAAAEQAVLLRAVDFLDLANPLLLFVRRGLLERYADARPGAEGQTARALLARLFGPAPEREATEPPSRDADPAPPPAP